MSFNPTSKTHFKDETKKPATDSPIKRILYSVVGTLMLVLGIIGMLLPILPTTPFLLLAAALYLRSSKRLYQWLIHHRLFGTYIYYYMEYRAVRLRAKVIALLLLWSTLILSMILVDHWILTLVLFIIGMLVTIHILTLKTLKKEFIQKKPQAKKTE